MLEQLPAEPAFHPMLGSIDDLDTDRSELPHRGFDVVLAKEVLHHAADREAALRELVEPPARHGRSSRHVAAARTGSP